MKRLLSSHRKYPFRPDVWTLLRQNLSKGQLLGYALANVVGLAVILVGVIFFLDTNHDSSDTDQYFSKDYVVLSKHVDGIDFSPITFDDDEIADIERQPWAHRVGRFTVAQFNVKAGVQLGGRGMSTYLFFESVPDEFFDVKPRDWQFDSVRHFIPIMVSKDYLTLYNFGFAIPQGLPQISEEVISAVPITLRLSGEGKEPEFFDAAIVGFSSRLNTFAVPQSFMDWANARYAPIDSVKAAKPSRLIVEVDQMASEEMNQYLEDNGYEAAGDKAGAANVSKFLSLVSMVVTSNGFVISALAFFILVLSIFLLLQKSREKLRYLMLLGFSPREVGQYYERVVLIANAVITVVAVLFTLGGRLLWSDSLHDLGLGGASFLPVLLVALVYLVGVSALNVYIIRRHLRRIWENKQ